MKMFGKIKTVFQERDFGFIIPDQGGADMYFRRSNVDPHTFARLAPNICVSFEVKTGSRGKPEAFDIVIELPMNSDQTTPSPPMEAAVSVFEGLNILEPTPAPKLVNPVQSSSLDKPKASEQEDVEESDESIRHSKWGKVKKFEDGHGFIAPDEGGKDLFVFYKNIAVPGYKILFKHESVLYDIGQDEQGRTAAVNVRPAPVRVFNGKILAFDEELEQGQILPNDGGEPLKFYANGVLDSDLSEYEEGDLVKYRLAESESGPAAVRITRLVDPRSPLERFADLGEYDRLLARLANPNTGAAGEEWNYRIRPSEFPYPILANYLDYTFKRIQQENKIVLGKNRFGEPVACFNTGLATAKQDELYAFFTKAKKKKTIMVSKSKLDGPEWVLEGFFKGTEGPMLDIPRMPELASYFEGDAFKNLVFDHSLDFRIRRDHILRDRRDRFLDLPNLPDSLRNDPDALADRFDTALNLAKRRVRRNYKTAIPTFNRGKINMLLPLCIVFKEKADLALLVERKSDYDGKTHYYIGWTVLTLDMAYNNARLLARPDTEWLTP